MNKSYVRKTGKSYISKAAFAIAIFISSIFADTIYLKDGREVNDAAVVEIGVNEVKYKIGKRDVLYTAKKSDIAIIFYKDGTKEVFGSESGGTGQGAQNDNMHSMQNIQNTVIVGNTPVNGNAAPAPYYERDTYENFTTGQRWATWGLNWMLPGVGSLLVMSDWTGAITQWVLLGGGLVMAVGLGIDYEEEECYSSSYSYSCGEIATPNGFFTAGVLMIVAGGVYNIVRSASYDKPKKVAYNEYDGFNFAVLPDKHGGFMPYFMYSKAF